RACRALPLRTPFPYTTLFRSAGAVRDVRRPASARSGGNHVSRWVCVPLIVGLALGAACVHRVSSYPYAWRLRGAVVSVNGTPERSEEHTSELQSHLNLVCRLL